MSESMEDQKRMKIKRSGRKSSKTNSGALFSAEVAYAESIVRSSLGDNESSIAALRESLEHKHDYAPAIMSLGSAEYQLGRREKGRKLLYSLISLPKNTPDLIAIIDEAGDFLIQSRDYGDGLEFYRAAADRFPEVAVFHQGVGCCAGHQGLHDEAVAASRRALDFEPNNQKLVNDFGYSLYEAGRLHEAEEMLQRAVRMDPSDKLARNNLELCRKKKRGTKRSRSAGQSRRTPPV